MEEFLPCKGFDLFVDPVQQAFVSFGNCRCDGILAAEFGDPDRIAFVLHGIGNDFGIVIGPGSGISVFQSCLGIGIGIVFLEFDLRVVGDQICLCRRTGNDDHFIVFAQFGEIRDHTGIRRDHTQRHVHVRKGKINLFRTFRRDREVRQDDIHFPGFQVLHPVGCFRGNIVNFYAQIFPDPLGKVYIISLIVSVFIHITKGILI